jgi:glycosyltransferase involved in cell wall biosynthesis
VSLLGFVPDRELTSLYKYSLGFVYPSLSEGFGLPGLDAIAAGTVCLASDIPIFREIYESIPFYFNPYDFSSIAETMKLVYDMSLSDRAKRVSLGRAFVKRYSWAPMRKRVKYIAQSRLSRKLCS